MKDNRVIQRPLSLQARPAQANLFVKGVIFEVWQWQQEMFNGDIQTFEQLKRPDTIIVLPVLEDMITLFLDEQHPGTKKMLRPVTGRVEKDETPVQAATRELLEETGYSANEFRLWDTWQPVIKIDWAVFLFIAHGLAKVADPRPDPGENITVRAFDINQLFNKQIPIELQSNEFLFKLYHARSDTFEMERVRKLLTP